jgi:TolB-like protein
MTALGEGYEAHAREAQRLGAQMSIAHAAPTGASLLQAIWASRQMATEPEREPLSTEVRRLESEVGPHAHHPLVHLRLFDQLKQRNVFRVAVLYLVVCWLILDPVHVLFHMLDVPVWANRLVVILMAVGFPAVLIFAWAYEITPEGLRPTVEIPHGESIRALTGRRLNRAIIAVLAVALAYFALDKFWISKHLTFRPVESAAQRTGVRASATPAAAAPAAAADFTPPAHSIAVLPFVNISGDKEQQYFSDGLTDELLNSLSRINELQVAARTSSFSFQGEHPDISTVAHKLNVGAVLEGSVRRSAHTIRITAQLVNGVTGFHLWSQTYDRDLGDVLALQTEIANAVASALKVALIGNVAAKIELGGTRDPSAFDAYLRGSKLAAATAHSAAEVRATIDAYTEALRADPNFALAYAARARAKMGWGYFLIEAPQDAFASARTDAGRAIALAPELGDGHAALGEVLENGFFDFAGAAKEHERALALAPGDARVLRAYSHFATYMGHADAAIASARRNVELDPLNVLAYRTLGEALHAARRYKDAIAAYDQAIGLSPGHASEVYQRRARSYYLMGNFPLAKASCEAEPDHYQVQLCMPLVYERLGQRSAAEVALATAIAAQREFSAYQYAQIYAQWGDTKKALDWLETALRIRDTGLEYLKTDAFLDPLRSQPRFQAIERQLKFPD